MTACAGAACRLARRRAAVEFAEGRPGAGRFDGAAIRSPTSEPLPGQDVERAATGARSRRHFISRSAAATRSPADPGGSAELLLGDVGMLANPGDRQLFASRCPLPLQLADRPICSGRPSRCAAASMPPCASICWNSAQAFSASCRVYHSSTRTRRRDRRRGSDGIPRRG